MRDSPGRVGGVWDPAFSISVYNREANGLVLPATLALAHNLLRTLENSASFVGIRENETAKSRRLESLLIDLFLINRSCQH